MELRLMRSAFKLLFNVSDEVVDTPEIQKWMKDAAIGIIEYEGYLTGEDKTFRDYRMQMTEIYEGDFEALSDYLKEMDSSLSTLPKWAVIFKTYNGIKSSDDLISQAETYCSTAEKRAEEDRARQMSELSKRPHEVQQSVEPAPTLEELLESSPVVDSSSSGADDESSAIKAEGDSMEAVQAEALGKAEVESEESFTNKNNIEKSKEDKEMADLQNTNVTGTTAQEEVVPGAGFDEAMNEMSLNKGFEEQTPAGNSKPKTANTDNTIAKDVLKNSEQERAAFVKSNFVTQLICSAEPSVVRLVNKAEEGSKLTGRYFKNTDMEHRKMTDAIDKEIKKFEKATGCVFHTVDESADPQVSFPRCFGSSDAKVAAQVYSILKTLLATPTALVRIKKSKETYQTKGYVVTGDQYLNDVDMKSLIMLKSTGAIYGAGMLDADGKPMADAVCFKLTIVKPRTTANESGAKVNGKTENAGFKANIVGVKKVDFLKNAANRIIIKATSTTDKTFAKFKAAVDIDGALQEASFRYNVYDEEGKQVFKKQDEVVAGATPKEPKAEVKTYTLGVYAEVFAVSDEVNSALIGKNDKLQNADAIKAYFNVKTATGREKAATIDYTSEMSDAIATSLTLMENGALDNTYGEGVGELIAKVAAATSDADASAVEAQQKGMM